MQKKDRYAVLCIIFGDFKVFCGSENYKKKYSILVMLAGCTFLYRRKTIKSTA
jgi:hypothetical protein